MADAGAWMPLYIGDYLADTMHLSGPEHGAYLLLIMHYWRTGPLPTDDRTLAAIARTDRKEWAGEIGEVVKAFFDEKGGKLHHKRIDAELAAASANIEQKRAAAHARWNRPDSGRTARASARAHASDNADGDATAYADADATAIRLECPSPSPSPVEEKLAASVPRNARGNGRHQANGAGPPRWADARIEPASKWGETDQAKADQPVCNGTALDVATEHVAEAARIELVPFIDKTLIGWLADGYELDAIVEAIRPVTERAGPGKPLAYFDKAVRERAPTWKPLASQQAGATP